MSFYPAHPISNNWTEFPANPAPAVVARKNPLFQQIFRDFAMQFTWNEFLSYSRDEASHIIDRLSATPQLCTQLMYGSGLRVGEVL